MTQVEDIVETLELRPHPEGGYYKEVYRSQGGIPEHALPDAYKGSRNYMTSIYFLLTSENFSAFHRINQDETWHFYKGTSLAIHMINEVGEYSKVIIGNNLEAGELLQFTVPGQVWFAAEVCIANSYALVGCTVAPGFDFRDFELAQNNTLKIEFPKHKKIIDKFTRT